MVHIEYINSKDTRIFLQVDPWACLYKLDKGESIEILAEITPEQSRFTIQESDDHTRILTLPSEEFYLSIDGKLVHWEDCNTNLPEKE